ncbi:hypothetical protein F5Y12DRAFT_583705 [Xylaria sp. FL1777]|nr:hypothetical protein F5Y12DRAFT_583705 [Xylaria sp. FL1777]
MTTTFLLVILVRSSKHIIAATSWTSTTTPNNDSGLRCCHLSSKRVPLLFGAETSWQSNAQRKHRYNTASAAQLFPLLYPYSLPILLDAHGCQVDAGTKRACKELLLSSSSLLLLQPRASSHITSVSHAPPLTCLASL